MGSVQVALFGFLVLIVAYPFSAVVWKGTNLRKRLWRLGCWRWVICCDRFYNEGINRVDMMERGGGAQTVQAYYELMLGVPRETNTTSMAPRLAAWRDDVRRHATRERVLTSKLEMIAIQNEAMQRMEPLVLPASEDGSQVKALEQGARSQRLRPLHETHKDECERIEQSTQYRELDEEEKREDGESSAVRV